MNINSYEDIVRHLGHKITVAKYGHDGEYFNASIECETCCEVLIDFDHRSEESENMPEAIVVVTDGILDNVYATIPLKITRVDYDTHSEERCLVAQFKTSDSTEFQPKGNDSVSFEQNVIERFGENELLRLLKLTGNTGKRNEENG